MDDKEKVIAALADPRFEWRTVEGVSRDTQLEAQRVLQVIEAMPDLVIRSRIPDASGRALYTTREHYKESHSSLQRALSIQDDVSMSPPEPAAMTGLAAFGYGFLGAFVLGILRLGEMASIPKLERPAPFTDGFG